MAETDTLLRSLHDLGLAAWFGGTLMGAVGLNGAANEVPDLRERSRVASAGWGRWVPVQAAAIGAHLIGGAGLLITNRKRVVGQSGARANTLIKSGLTLAALGITAYSRQLGRKVDEAGYVPSAGGTKPAAETPPEVAKAQQQLRALQWTIPAVTGSLVILGAQQGEQQKPRQLLMGTARTFGRRLNPAA
jgi:hypothetical protein